MASPFAVFRKNQRILMALTVGFAMIAFIAADVITPQNFPIFLGALLGALALWLLSGKGGTEGWLIAGVGAIVGAVVGMYGPGVFRDNAVVYTNSGNLSNEQIETINRRQDIANQFLRRAYETVREKAENKQQPPISPPTLFGIPLASSAVENATLTYLFQEEADDLGIQLDDRDVTRFIEDVTGGRLGNADLRRIRSELQVGTGDLVEILREQIRARDAFMLLVPKTGPTPLELWSDFKKLQSEAQVTVATVPVEAFTSEIPDPGDEQLEAFFQQYRSTPPAPDGTPGFLVPRQVQVAYLEIPFESLKNSVTPPTDAEVRAYYDKNRAQFEFGSDRPGATGTPGESDIPGTPTPLEAPRPGTAPKANAADGSEGSAAPSSDTQPETPAEPAPQDDAPAESAAPQETAPAESTPAEESPAPDQAAIRRSDLEFVAFQEEKPADTPAADASAPENASSADAATKPTADAPGSEKAAEQPTLSAPSATDRAASEPSQAILDQIRGTLLNQRARNAADTKLEQVREDVDRIIEDVVEAIPLPEDSHDPEQRAAFEARRREGAKDVVKRMQAYAKKSGLQFQMTPYMSYEDLTTSDDYAIGKAIRWEKNAPLFGRETTPIADAIFFQTNPEQPLTTIPAQSLLNDSRYVAVKAADVLPRPADLSEEGMRDKVVTAWKLREARQLAEDRATELVNAAKKSGFEAAMKDATITGKPKGKPLETTAVRPFTWLRRSSAPQTDFAPPQILPTELAELPAAGEEFMRTVFDELKVGGIGMAPAQDESAYYVVKVDRKSLESDLPKIREDFIKENFFHDPLDAFVGQPMNPFRRRSMAESRQTMEEWLKGFRERHGVVERVAEES